jgi:D-glycero-D-manno-heptose 1,7-bisphosphate phosphatase
MIFNLLHTWPVIAAGSVMFGDKKSDIEAAEAAGLPGVLFTGGRLQPLVEATLSKIRADF